MLDRLQLAVFEPLVGRRVGISRAGEEELEVELVEARGLGGGEGAARQPFSLLYRGPAAPILEQGIYRLAHGELGELELFLVPLGPDREGGDAILYEAVFN